MWILIIVSIGGSIHSVEFDTKAQCLKAGQQVETIANNEAFKTVCVFAGN